MRSAAETIYDQDKQRRVTIFQNQDGTFGFEEDYFSDDPLEQCWVSKCFPGSRCGSLDEARREVHGRVAWLKEEIIHE
jgi:hypothetical protein